MKIEDRIYVMYEPISDCGAAIDAARVLARITGMEHELYRKFSHKMAWYVRAIGDDVPSGWDRTGGVYTATDDRAVMQTDPSMTPELAAERGILEPTDFDDLRAQYQKFAKFGRSRYTATA